MRRFNGRDGGHHRMVLVPSVRKIAVLRANGIGDWVFAQPALQALRAAYPGAELVLLGAPWHARFLAGRPGPVDRVLVVPPLPGIREPVDGEPRGRLGDFLRRGRSERFDLAVQLHGGGGHSNPLVRSLGAGLTAGLRAPGAPPLDRWLRYEFYQPEIYRYLEAAGLVGAGPVTDRPDIPVVEADLAEARRVAGTPGAPRVAIHPGATDGRRRWPPVRFAAVADELSRVGYEVVITGSAADRPVVDELTGHLHRPVRDLAGALTLGGLAGLLAGTALVVGNDSGPLHLAGAVGTRAIGVYWVGNLINCAPAYRARQQPLISWTIHCPQCGADCTRDLYPARGGGSGCGHRCSFVTDVPVSEVLDAARDLLG